MITVVLVKVFGVSSASMAQHSPAHGMVFPSGQCTSPSGMCSRSPIRRPNRALIRRSLRQNAPAAVNWGVAASASLTAVTARRCASRDKPGVVAVYGRPQLARPDLVSQTQRGPGASRSRPASPFALHLAATAPARLSVTSSTAPRWSSCTPYISATNTKPFAWLSTLQSHHEPNHLRSPSGAPGPGAGVLGLGAAQCLWSTRSLEHHQHRSLRALRFVGEDASR